MKSKVIKGLISGVIGTSILVTSTHSVSADEKLYIKNRIYGQNRIQTSVQIANEYAKNGTLQYIVLATANNFPDALTGSMFAAKHDAPILLVGDTVEESKETLDFIKGHLLDGGTVFILGGEGAVSSNIENAVRNLGISNIQRLSGKDRAETSKAINNALYIEECTPVVIATENDFPDALSASGFASKNKFPILLSDKDSLPQATIDLLQKIKPSVIYIVGGEGVISQSVVSQIKNITGGISDNSIKRIWGADRYATSLEIAKEYYNRNPYFSNAILATGENFPDALSGSALASKKNAPVILVDENSASKQKQYLDSTYVNNITFLGGTGVISPTVEGIFKTGDLKQVAGLRTPAGIITSKFRYEDTIKTGASFDELKSIAVSVNPKDNPELFSEPDSADTPYFDLNKMGLSDKIFWYHYTQDCGRFLGKRTCDEFIKILGFYYDYSENFAYVVYTTDTFMTDPNSGVMDKGIEKHGISDTCNNSIYAEYLKNEN